MRKIGAEQRIRGFTMIEVLIAIVVIAFGLLGIAGLQAFALKNNQSSSLRVAATVLANDIIDRIHSNPEGVRLGAYDARTLSAYATAVPSCTTTAGCTAAELAQNDLYEWQQRVAASLPDGVGIVCLTTQLNTGNSAAAPDCDGLGNNLYAVKIWYSDDRTRTRSAVLQRFSWGFTP